jgi:hypothetical protein
MKNDHRFFAVAGNEYGINPQDLDNCKLLTLEDAEKRYDQILEECDVAALFEVTKLKLKMLKSDCLI